jgi:hypothetical protein
VGADADLVVFDPALVIAAHCANQCANARIPQSPDESPFPNPQSAMDAPHMPAAASVSVTTMSC